LEKAWRRVKYLVALLLALLVPTAAIAKGECKEDKQKFCKDIVEAKGDIGACLNQHMADLSEACKTQLEAKAKAKNAEESAKMGKEEGTHTEPGHSAQPESDTSKIDQPERRNPTTGNETPKQ
jgi:Cysteine rich repeat